MSCRQWHLFSFSTNKRTNKQTIGRTNKVTTSNTLSGLESLTNSICSCPSPRLRTKQSSEQRPTNDLRLSFSLTGSSLADWPLGKLVILLLATPAQLTLEQALLSARYALQWEQWRAFGAQNQLLQFNSF